MLPSDRWRTLATFLSVASTLESACSISAPNSSNILRRRNVFEHHWSGLIILDSATIVRVEEAKKIAENVKDLKYLHCLFIKFVGNVMAHVPDVAHAVGHHLHRLVLPPHHLLLLLQVHNEALPESSDFETAVKISGFLPSEIMLVSPVWGVCSAW